MRWKMMPPKILIPIDHNLNFIDAKYNGETYRGNEEFAINLFCSIYYIMTYKNKHR